MTYHIVDMTQKERELRDSKVVKYKIFENHTGQQTAEKFNLSVNQVWVILRKYKKQNGK